MRSGIVAATLLLYCTLGTCAGETGSRSVAVSVLAGPTSESSILKLQLRPAPNQHRPVVSASWGKTRKLTSHDHDLLTFRVVQPTSESIGR